MRQETDIKAVIRSVSIMAKSIPPEFDGGFSVRHIIFGNIALPSKNIPLHISGKRENGCFFIDKDNYKDIVDWFIADVIGDMDDVAKIFYHIRKADRISVFDFVKHSLGTKDYSNILGDIWQLTEFPHQYGMRKLVALFKRTSPRFLMDENDFKVWQALPQEIRVFRGVQKICRKPAKVRGLSWTMSLEKAKWFANRWKNKGKVWQADIYKDDCFAYFDGRKEKEIVLNPNRLRNLQVVSDGQ
jgi:hypothetical protein